MSLCALGMAEEFRDEGVAFNCLWPRTAIATSAVQFELGGDAMMEGSRLPQIMADAAHAILSSNSRELTGKFLIDDEVLMSLGMTLAELDKRYNVVKGTTMDDLVPDFFC